MKGVAIGDAQPLLHSTLSGPAKARLKAGHYVRSTPTKAMADADRPWLSMTNSAVEPSRDNLSPDATVEPPLLQTIR